MKFKEFYKLDEMPHVVIHKNNNDDIMFDFRKEDNKNWLSSFLDIIKGKKIKDSTGKMFQLSKDEVKNFVDEVKKNVFFKNFIKSDIKTLDPVDQRLVNQLLFI